MTNIVLLVGNLGGDPELRSTNGGTDVATFSLGTSRPKRDGDGKTYKDESGFSMNPIGRCDAQVDALRAELGAVLADRILEAEAADFLWDSRVRERYLGQHIDTIGDDGSVSEDLSRVAVLSFLDGAWHTGICLVDGEGFAIELLWQRTFGSRAEAEYACVHAR